MPISGGVIPGFDLESDPLITVADGSLFSAQYNVLGAPAYVGNWDNLEVRMANFSVGPGLGERLWVEWANDPSYFIGSTPNVSNEKVSLRSLHLPSFSARAGVSVSPIARLRLENLGRWVRMILEVQTPASNHKFQGIAFGSNRQGDVEQYPVDNQTVISGAGTTRKILNQIQTGRYRVEGLSVGAGGSLLIWYITFDGVEVGIMNVPLPNSLAYPEANTAVPTPGVGDFSAPLCPLGFETVFPAGGGVASMTWEPY